MRVQSIGQTNYLKTRSVLKKQSVQKSNENVSFKGPKGALKGGLIGATAATAFGLLTGGIGFAVLPLWTVGGAIGGSESENENKENKDTKK